MKRVRRIVIRRACTARCAWCFEPIFPAAGPHPIVRATKGPDDRIHFHEACYPEWEKQAPVEKHEPRHPRPLELEWTPERIEEVRFSANMTVSQFCMTMRISGKRYQQLMNANEKALTLYVRVQLARMASIFQADTHWDKRLDWNRGLFVFSLRMHLGLDKADFCARLRISYPALRDWELHGVPKSSWKQWAKLNLLAQDSHFTRKQVQIDRDWTGPYLEEVIEKSNHTIQQWVDEAGITRQMIWNVVTDRRRFTRDLSWKLTQAAKNFAVRLPPRLVYDKPREMDVRRHRRWILDELVRVGTVPDRVLAGQLGCTTHAVTSARIGLGMKRVKAEGWNGVPLPPLPPWEVERRWKEYLAKDNERTNVVLPPVPDEEPVTTVD